MTPFVDFKLYTTVQIGSTPTLIFGKPNTCRIDEVQITNTVSDNIFVDIYVLREDGTTPFFRKHQAVAAYQALNLLKGSLIILEAGDLLYASSDFSGNLFDCLISYEMFLELGGTPHATRISQPSRNRGTTPVYW